LTGKPPEPIDDAIDGTDDRRLPDLGALRRTDALLDALSGRRDVSSEDAEDPAFALLKAFVDDVDAGAPPLSPAPRENTGRRPPRRLSRTLVSLCAATTVLMTTGVAAAGGVLTPFAPAQDRSEPKLRTSAVLPQAREAASKAETRRLTRPPRFRRHGTSPRDGEPTGTPQAPPPPKPVKTTPTPQPVTYGVYNGPVDTPAPSPSSTPRPEPVPSGTPDPDQPPPAVQESPALVAPSTP
jgi:hypothetical protein